MASEEIVREAARVIWNTSRKDESTISALGADIVAHALSNADLLRQEMTEEFLSVWFDEDGFPVDIHYFTNKEAAIQEARKKDNGKAFRRYVTKPQEIE